MSNLHQLLQDIDDSPTGPRIAAIFDFDGTLIAGYSATAFIREQLKRGDLSARQFVELIYCYSLLDKRHGKLGNKVISGCFYYFCRQIRGN